MVSALLLVTGCVSNKAFRTETAVRTCFDQSMECGASVVENHLAFDLTFIEFSERGNLFDRDRARYVLDFIDQQAKSPKGAAVFVYVHGWKHNASANDTNVKQFADFLARAAENEIVGQRKVIGLYIGWRGKSVTLPVFRETTYWARKTVAEEIGAGGVTEIFSELHQTLVAQFNQAEDPTQAYKNIYVIVGHSFGGAIVLSAIHDVLLNEIIASAEGKRSEQAVACRKIARFADSVLLLNPAIEANRIILLREAASRCKFSEDQPSLLKVLSSDGDFATHVFFPIGQYANITSTITPNKLKRSTQGREIVLDEKLLDVTTAGNLQQIRTGYLGYDKETNAWRLDSCQEHPQECGITRPDKQKNHYPVHANDPLKFIKTDRNFIENHSDVFNCYVQSFITAGVRETQAVERGFRAIAADRGETESNTPAGCSAQKFDFKQCFNNQLDEYDCLPPDEGIFDGLNPGL